MLLSLRWLLNWVRNSADEGAVRFVEAGAAATLGRLGRGGSVAGAIAGPMALARRACMGGRKAVTALFRSRLEESEAQ